MHTVALASDGSIFTWGCNDEKALGRPGAENVPLKVEFDFKAEHIAAGDSHSIAYNTQTNQVYYWGCYRVSTLINTLHHQLIPCHQIYSSKLSFSTNLSKDLYNHEF